MVPERPLTSPKGPSAAKATDPFATSEGPLNFARRERAPGPLAVCDLMYRGSGSLLKETTQFHVNFDNDNFYITIDAPLFRNANNRAKFTANFIE